MAGTKPSAQGLKEKGAAAGTSTGKATLPPAGAVSGVVVVVVLGRVGRVVVGAAVVLVTKLVGIDVDEEVTVPAEVPSLQAAAASSKATRDANRRIPSG